MQLIHGRVGLLNAPKDGREEDASGVVVDDEAGDVEDEFKRT